MGPPEGLPASKPAGPFPGGRSDGEEGGSRYPFHSEHARWEVGAREGREAHASWAPTLRFPTASSTRIELESMHLALKKRRKLGEDANGSSGTTSGADETGTKTATAAAERSGMLAQARGGFGDALRASSKLAGEILDLAVKLYVIGKLPREFLVREGTRKGSRRRCSQLRPCT